MQNGIIVKVSILLFSVFCMAGLNTAKTSYKEVLGRMEQIVKNNSDIVELIELGKSDSGEIIKGVRVRAKGQGLGAVDQSPKLLVASHHGNEILSTELAVQFLRDIIQEQRQPTGKGIENSTIYVFPVLNIGGYNQQDRMEDTVKGASIDPNRDYPDPCNGGNNTFQLQSTKALADFMRAKNIQAAVTVHGYIGTFTFPWGTYARDTHTEDHAQFDTLGRSAVQENGYSTGTHADVIYPTVGAFEDWAYYELGAWTMLLELDNNPDLKKDSKAVQRFFAEAPAGRSTQHGFHGACDLMPAAKDIRSRP